MDIIGFIPQFGGLLYTLFDFVVALSVIVAVHDYGHYIVGRWSGIHAEVFSLGFGPVLFSRVDKHGTRWQIAALPFGGYVKFLGDSNAASGRDDAAMKEAAEDPVALRRTMHGAPLWARLAAEALAEAQATAPLPRPPTMWTPPRGRARARRPRLRRRPSSRKTPSSAPRAA